MRPIDVPKGFGFTDDHALLRQTARRMLADHCAMDRVREVAADGGFDADLWRELGKLGWAGLLVGEDRGGAGLDYLSMSLVLEECGRTLLPAPLLSTALCAAAVELAGDDAQRERLLPGLAAGETIGAIAVAEPGGSWEPDAIGARARRDGDGYALSGAKVHVGWAAHARVVVAAFVVADDENGDGEIGVFAVPLPTNGVRVEPEIGVDATRPGARVIFDDARVSADARLARGDGASWRAVHLRAWALLAAEMVGAAEAMLGRTRDYAIERIQFDRPIGAFQAVKHPIVNVMIAIEDARSLAVAAAAALDADPAGAEIACRMAKARATEALSAAVDRGVQLHGGYGFTWDCDAHYFFKRALWSAATLGDAVHHRRHLATALLGDIGG